MKFCVHNEDERSECRRLRSIPPLNAECSADSADCLAWECVIAEVRPFPLYTRHLVFVPFVFGGVMARPHEPKLEFREFALWLS